MFEKKSKFLDIPIINISHFISIVIIYFFVIIPSIISINIEVSNEIEFKSALENFNNKNIIITSSFNINDNYLLNSSNNNDNNNNISIKGRSKNIILSFSNIEDYITFKDYDSISLENLTIEGNIYFDNCKNVTISFIQWDGKIKSVNTNDQEITFNNIKYFNNKTYKSQWGINLYGGNYFIKNSSFYGSKLILENIIQVSGYDEETFSQLNISNSYFSGEYKSRVLNTNFVNFSSSNTTYINGFSNYCGGLFYMNYSKISVNNSTIMNTYSNTNGGSFCLDKNNELDITNINVTNSTSFNNV
eukprot:jgi/Orpsp1_1/1189834/evm.model.d7180000074835.1